MSIVSDTHLFWKLYFDIILNQLFIADWTISSWVTVAFLPAALYALQNVAALQAYQYLDSMTFIVLNQTKTLSAALCCYLVMGRKQSLVQILSLFLLLLSALVMKSLVSLDSLLSGSAPLQVPDWHSAHWAKGVAPIMLASLLSGLSGALSQKDLQAKGGGRNAYLFSMELSIASICILGCSLVLSPDGKRIAEDGFWHEWTVFTWIPIFTSAMGGIIVGLVTKYVGSVRKGFALILGIFLSGVVQAVVQPEVGVSKDQAAGGILAAISLWMHASNPPISKEKRD